jgi:hypothetical protein
MAVRPHYEGLTWREVTILTAGSGCLLLLVAVMYLDRPSTGFHSVGPASVLFVCGALSIAASWPIHRRSSFALTAFCVSWTTNALAFFYVRLLTHSDPLWYLVCYAVLLTCFVYILISKARRGMSLHPNQRLERP